MTRTRGGPKQPYTTGYINDAELHFIKRAAGGGRHETECGRIEVVSDLKDRTAAEVLGVEEHCQDCITVAWNYHLGREARR